MASSQPVAIIGMACRFPGDATSPSKLWKLCAEGRDGWSSIPEDRFDVKSLFHSDSTKTGRSHVTGGYFLKEDVACFDADFFNISADLANAMDPQTRLMLELTFEAIEDAGIPLEKLAGSDTSVFAGHSGSDYRSMQSKDLELMPRYFLTGTSMNMLANHISQFFDFQGASMSIDTACSAGLAALHQGCQTIQSGESSLSIVGASNIMLSPEMFIAISTHGMLSPDGKCCAWDERAQGFGRGEGVAILLLKSLEAATRDGDRIHSIIRQTGLNQDGKKGTVNSSSTKVQVKLIEDCYRRAGLDISETGFVEAHMIGNEVGDATETKTLAETFGKAQTHDPLFIGSVKTNIGHTGSVSGLASIIKTTFAMKHSQIPPNLNFEKTNPKIKLNEQQLQIPKHLTTWPQEKLHRASINNFGYGGTNAHVILDGPPTWSNKQETKAPRSLDVQSAQGRINQSRIYMLSAMDSAACLSMAKNLAGHLRTSMQDGNSPCPGDLAYTLSERRSRLPCKMAIKADTVEELATRLEQSSAKPRNAMKQPRLGFVYNGQGAQWHAMGRELITAYPVFSASLHKADQIFKDFGASWSLYDELMRDAESTRVGQIDLAQAISVALQLCLTDLMKSWGINPSAVTSHSSGEMAAAYSVGALSFRQALGAVYFRGPLGIKYRDLLPIVGGMLAAGIGPEQVQPYISNTSNGRAVVACINSPESVTIAGDLSAIDEVETRLVKDGMFARKLKVPLAYHSHHMLPMVPEYNEQLFDLIREAPKCDKRIVYTSPVTGDVLLPDTLTPDHWALNLTEPVRFSEAFEKMCSPEVDVDVIVEIGPHNALAGPMRQILGDRKLPQITCLKRSINAVETMQDLVCELILHGHPVNLQAVNFPFNSETQAFVPDLPSYPWDHSKRYWIEPRISKETRYKRHPPHELLGLPISGSTGPIPTWRNFLRISDLPWLTNYQKDSKAILPGAGYISMAIEAVRYAEGFTSSVLGYQLSNIDIMEALTIHDSSEGVEVHTRLFLDSVTRSDNRRTYKFEISSVNAEGTWATNCKGSVSTEINEGHKSASFIGTDIPTKDSFFAGNENIQSIDIASLYETLQRMNAYHGSIPENPVEGRRLNGKAILNLPALNMTSTPSDYLIHPTTLDAIVQTTFSALSKRSVQNSTLHPDSIGSVFVPCSLVGQAGSKLKAFTEVRRTTKDTFISNIVVCNADSHQTNSSCLRITEFRYKSVSLSLDRDAEIEEPVLYTKMHLEPDALHQVPDFIKDTIKIVLNDDEIALEKKMLRSSYHFICDAVSALQTDDKITWAPHHIILYNWMKQVVERGNKGTLSPGSESWSKTSKGMKQILNDELSSGSAAGKLLVRIGENLASIMRLEIIPLDLMMENNLLSHYYAEIPHLKDRTYKHLVELVERFAFKNPGANVLEIGVGSEGVTKLVLNGFSPNSHGSGSLLGHYTFADISPSFTATTKPRSTSLGEMVDFARLNIESDPVEQAFPTGVYDLVVASMVLHTTQNLHKTMSNVRKLLKPGGQLLLIETTQDRLDSQLIFGTLPEWWLVEEPFRKESPNVSVKIWDGILKETGFTGVDFNIGDCEQSDFQSTSVMLSKALPNPSYPSLISIVTARPASQSAVTKLAESIQKCTGVLPVVEDIDHLTKSHDKVCIFTAETTGPLAPELDTDSLRNLQNLLSSGQGALWLSCSSLTDTPLPSSAQTQELLRIVRREHPSSRFVQLDFTGIDDPWTEKNIDHTVNVFQQAFDYNKAHADVECEYVVRDSVLHVPRLFTSKHKDSKVADHVPEPEFFNQPGRKLIWDPQVGVAPNTFCISNDTEQSDNIPSGMVQVEAKAFGLNPRDANMVLNNEESSLIGHEFAGIVTRLGPNTDQSGLCVGDRICGIAEGCFASTSRVLWTAVTKIPEDMTFEDGAAIPFSYATAYHSLVRVARLSDFESVLIHEAFTATGQAAIVTAQHFGANVYLTCSTEAERNLLLEKYHISPSHIFSSRNSSFTSGVMQATNGRGVDVIFSSLSGRLLKENWSCIAPFGRLVEIGKVGTSTSICLDTTPFGHCATYASVDILQLNKHHTQFVQEALTESLRILCDKGIDTDTHPVYPIQSHSISDLTSALKHVRGEPCIGKIVLVPGERDTVDVIVGPRPVSLTTQDATFMIIGGLGGVSGAIASWMVDKGAKNILIASQNAEEHPNASRFIQEAMNEGCNVLLRNCDVSNESSLVELLAYCSSVSLPPIKGVINVTMDMEDAILEPVKLEHWQRVVKSKACSSANLHKCLPDLLFFVMLSSSTRTSDNISQAIHAAGNTFEDALARFRTASGLPGVSLSLCATNIIGLPADDEDKTDGMSAHAEDSDSISLEIDTLLRHIEAAVVGAPHRASVEDAQVVIGMASWDRLGESSVIRKDRRFGTLRLQNPQEPGAVIGEVAEAAVFDPTEMLSQALESGTDGPRLVAQAIGQKLSAIFNFPAEDLDLAASMSAYGVDSLVAVELRNWFSGVAKARLSISEIVQGTSLSALGTIIIERSTLVTMR